MRERDVIFYDGACGMCRGSSRWFKRLDWLGRIERRDLTRVAEGELPADLGAVPDGMPMRTRSGDLLVGFPAVRRALLQTPLGFLPALAMYLPGVSHAGRRVYARIARSRKRDSCSLDAG